METPRVKKRMLTVSLVIVAVIGVVVIGNIALQWLVLRSPAYKLAQEAVLSKGVDRPQDASPISIELMKEDWFWNILDENSPFGNDQGADAASAFRHWRRSNKNVNPKEFAKLLLAEWGSGLDKWFDTKPESVLPFVPTESYVTVTMDDEALIGIAFAQLVDEGYVHPDINTLALKAIQNERVPNINRFDSKEERLSRLARMESVLRSAPTGPTKNND